LSGGQRQRVALARAIYGRPKLLVLDEPNSSLDDAGEQALMNTLQSLKAQGSSVLLITHRTSVLPLADKLLMLREGQVAMFGARDEVLAALQKAQTEGQSQAQVARAPQAAPAQPAPAHPPRSTPTFTTSTTVNTSTVTMPISTAPSNKPKNTGEES
jgi:ATP-binding cassette subfamily C exporter for protease/lipase